MHLFGLTAKITAHAGQRDTLAQLLLEAAAGLQVLEGCYLYLVSITETEADVVFVTEVWSSAEAHAASLALEETKAAIQRGRPLIAAFESTKLVTLGGKGI